MFASLPLRATMALVLATGFAAAQDAELYPAPQPKADGYRGIWYFNQPSNDQYHYKYSGGFATYPQQQGPIAYYAAAVDKTFFCYGGTAPGKNELLHMVSYFNHKTGEVPRPTILLNKKTSDAHDNPVMTIDKEGYIWIFSNSHGASRASYIHRSKRPYDIDEFEHILTTNFSYGHALYQPAHGFLFLHTIYEDNGRSLYWMTSKSGEKWTKPTELARFALGHYQITAQDKQRVASAFNYHPQPVGLNARTNLYYVQTTDGGRTWTDIEGNVLTIPLTEPATTALVHDYASEGLLVYLKTMTFDAAGHPVILYLTSESYKSGPQDVPRTWRTARWTGTEWQIRPAVESDHNYDFGSLYTEPSGTWRLIAPTDPGPQPHGTGGEMVMWVSSGQGANWTRLRTLTENSQRNHTYARQPVDAHPGFYALWADGDAWQPSESGIYFTNQAGTQTWRLPPHMDTEAAKPQPLRTAR